MVTLGNWRQRKRWCSSLMRQSNLIPGRKPRRSPNAVLSTPRILGPSWVSTKWRMPNVSSQDGDAGTPGFQNQTSHDFFWQNQGNYNMSIQCWAWGFGMTYQSVRLDCSSNGLKTIVPIRPIACLSGVLDLQEAHVRIFWVGFFCCLAGYQHGR